MAGAAAGAAGRSGGETHSNVSGDHSLSNSHRGGGHGGGDLIPLESLAQVRFDQSTSTGTISHSRPTGPNQWTNRQSPQTQRNPHPKHHGSKP